MSVLGSLGSGLGVYLSVPPPPPLFPPPPKRYMPTMCTLSSRKIGQETGQQPVHAGPTVVWRLHAVNIENDCPHTLSDCPGVSSNPPQRHGLCGTQAVPTSLGAYFKANAFHEVREHLHQATVTGSGAGKQKSKEDVE